MATTLLPRPLRRRSAFVTALAVASAVLLATAILSGVTYQIFIHFSS